VKTKNLLLLGMLLLLVLWPAQAAADGPVVEVDDGRIFVDEDVRLEVGEIFEGDLGVLNGDLTIPQSSVVEGDVFVTNGDVRIAGRVDGDLALVRGNLTLSEGSWVEGELFGLSSAADVAGRVGGDASWMFGDAELRSSAVVEGDVMVVSGRLERQAGARILGEELPDVRLPDLPLLRERLGRVEIPDVPQVRTLRQQTAGQRLADLVGRAVMVGVMSLLFVGLALLIVLVWPRATHRVAECINLLPVQSLGLGLLTFLLAAILEALAMVLMILLILVAAALIGTVILIPIGLLLILLSMLLLLPVPLALAAGMVLGWVGVAEVVGDKVTQLLRARKVSALGKVLVGLLVTVPLAALLWLLKPVCCAWPFIILLTSLGLGAVFHTRFGRQACHKPPEAELQVAEPEVQLAETEALPAAAMDEEAGQPDEPPKAAP
jgi:cytoskeletal protein CcmA (bactofilin family)